MEENLWKNKIINFYQITDETTARNALSSGITITENYFRILTKNLLKELPSQIKKGEAVIIVSVPDSIFLNIFDGEEEGLDEYKSQFDYVDNSDNNLDNIGALLTLDTSIYEDLRNFMPAPLVWEIILIDDHNKPMVCKNQYYFDTLSDEDKNTLSDLIKRGVCQEIEYEDYLSLIEDFYSRQDNRLIKKRQ